VENLALGLIGWLGYRLWKKRQIGTQKKSTEDTSVSNANALESSMVDELDGSKQAPVHESDVESTKGKEAETSDAVEIDTPVEEPQPEILQENVGTSETEADVLNDHEEAVIEESEVVNLDELPANIDFNADLAEPVVAMVDTEPSESAQPVGSADGDSEYAFPEEDDEGADELLDELNAMLDSSDEELAAEADLTSSEDLDAQEQVIKEDDKEQMQ
jgi:hypothetical protein